MGKRMIVGIIIVILGILLLADSILIPYAHHIVFSWQVLLIIIGIILSVNKKPVLGIVLILIGIWFLLSNFFERFVFTNGLITGSIGLIIIGIGLITHAITRKNRESYGHSDKKTFANTATNEEESVCRDYVFSYSKEKWEYDKLKNIKIETVFSNLELDFAQLELPEENRIHIKVTSIFSYVTLYVQTNWNVKLRQNGIFSSFSDERIKNNIDFEKTVLLEIEGVFSGGEIKCCV